MPTPGVSLNVKAFIGKGRGGDLGIDIPGRRDLLVWTVGACIGMAGGYATLVVLPVAVLIEVLAVLALALTAPRLVGLAGALVGHGAMWSWLLVTSSVACFESSPPQCGFSLPFGPAHLTDAAAWQTETRIWLLGSVVILLVGLALTVALTIRARRLAAAV